MGLAQRLTPRVLVYDIETRPMVSLHWQAYGDQSFSPEQVLDPGGVLCWAARWQGESKIRFASDHHDGHEAMIGQLWELLDAASVVIGYNQIRFDDKRVNREFLLAGMPLPAPAAPLDLLRAVKLRFGFPINKLQHVATELGIGSKVAHTGWGMWRRCILDPDTGQPYLGPVPIGGGDPKQWALMKKYCRHDVELTTQVADRLRPYVKNHPHPALYSDAPLDACPNCGGCNFTPSKPVTTPTSSFPGFRCSDCGANARGTKRLHPVTERRSA